MGRASRHPRGEEPYRCEIKEERDGREREREREGERGRERIW